MKMRKNRLILGITAFIAAIFILIMPGINTVHATTASGNLYTYTLGRHYAHPVTGEIRDSGGRAKYTTGQGMVEGCTYPTCLLEETDDGEYYVTIKMGLFDYTHSHDFWVQRKGESGWHQTRFGTTGSGTDSNGGTKDICIQVPGKDFVVMGKMYVVPMGREVYWYMDLADGGVQGNTAGFNATIVTEESTKNQQPETQAVTEAQTQAATEVPTTSAPGNTIPENRLGTGSAPTTYPVNLEEKANIDEAVSKAQGINLSTAKGKVGTLQKGKENKSTGSANMFLIYGLIIAGAAVAGFAIIMHIFLKTRKNMNRDHRDDDED